MNNQPILAIDTSCDDTSAAVVDGTRVISNVIASQAQLHKEYGGVFPTVAKQAHKENIQPVIGTALKRAQLQAKDLVAVAVTAGPGLAPALEVGLAAAKSFAKKHNLPLIAVNHIEGHVLSILAQRNPRKGTALTPAEQLKKVNFPVLAVVVSGGHTEFIQFKEIGNYIILGRTLDDAAGESLDKIGRMLNLGYPAGPVIEEFAKNGDPKAFEFPLPLTDSNNYNLSFSGLKTYARNKLKELTAEKPLTKQQTYDFCASAQYAVFRHITYKLGKVLENEQVGEVWLGGGVAANITLRKMIRKKLRSFVKNQQQKGRTNYPKIPFKTPYDEKLCMDNGAMIGVVAGFKLKNGELVKDPTELERKPRWRIDQL